MLSLSLDVVVLASGTIRPIERETAADDPLAKVSVATVARNAGRVSARI